MFGGSPTYIHGSGDQQQLKIADTTVVRLGEHTTHVSIIVLF